MCQIANPDKSGQVVAIGIYYLTEIYAAEEYFLNKNRR